MNPRGTTAEIISTGTELLQGLYPDTNAQYLSKVLNEHGIGVVYHTAVGDERESLSSALGVAAGRVDIILIGGGLGPTEDDVTRDVVAEFVGLSLEQDEDAAEWIRQRLILRGIPLEDYILRQTFVPTGSIIMHNRAGTAPGFIVPKSERRPCIVALPGPPREMRPMVEQYVVPFLCEHFPVAEFVRTVMIHTAGVPESYLNTTLKDMFTSDPRVSLALLASVGMVNIRFTVREDSEEKLHKLCEEVRNKILERLDSEDVYGFDGTLLEEAVGELLIEKKYHVACAESCTGGLLSMRLTNVSGSSDYITENYVTYSKEAKKKLLGLKAETLEKHGAVSPETAYEMAAGVRRIAKSDIGIGITGIAGPTGGSEEKPVGLVFFGLATKRGVRTFKRLFQGNRYENRFWATDFALDLIRRCILHELDPDIRFRFFSTDQG